jgi:hypothetical protein
VGYPAPQNDTATSALVHLGDFYNPTGQGAYPAGSPYGEGGEMPKLLWIHAAVVWSGPDNYQADMVTPSALAAHGPCLAALTVLHDGEIPGQAADLDDAVKWATKYQANYPVVVDPAQQLGPIFNDQAYPTNILIDTVSMKILEVVAGVPGTDSSFYTMHIDTTCP